MHLDDIGDLLKVIITRTDLSVRLSSARTKEDARSKRVNEMESFTAISLFIFSAPVWRLGDNPILNE